MLCSIAILGAGAVGGYYGGRLDTLIMRLADVMFAFPDILLAILITGILGKQLVFLFLALALVGWPGMVRLVRGQVLSVKSNPYIEAASVVGASRMRILLRHVFPNIFAVIVVICSINIGFAIITEAALSFLGLGTQPPQPSWGRMLNEAQSMLFQAPQLAVWPGLAIVLSVLGLNLMGDGLRDLLDPRLARAR